MEEVPGFGASVSVWVDSGDIDARSAFAEVIEQGIEESCLVRILTDNCAIRELWRKEVNL
ncbi:MAG: hypothetical protein PVI97_08880 [Candidatus Thiodiazotropha sp.]